jgi:hypothetical protein
VFIVSSRTFTTFETMTNANTARRWSLDAFAGDTTSVAKHLSRCLRSGGSTPGTLRRWMDRQLVIKLTLPETDDFYADLVRHSNVVRVVALSGGRLTNFCSPDCACV